ncbi:alpha-L-fucosidase [Streptomyces sp. RKAG337]|uniref:alpha-L-fucosidase n=1 Tax=Streptomyces sp. RKAG337 TaxID=2893404 RepID=UPI0035A940E7
MPMSRSARTLHLALAFVVALVTAIGLTGGPATAAAPPTAAPAAAGPGTNYAYDDPFTSARTQWWRDDHFGMFIHYGAYSQLQGTYTRPDGSVCRNAEWIERDCAIPKAQYEDIAAQFNPASFDANAIVKLAKDAGQRYIVQTAKHHEGYAMWPTKVNTWNLRDHSSFSKSRDILAEMKAAADSQGIKFGLYYSIWDWHNPNFTADFPQYKKDMYAQLKELVDNYHPAVLWFDGEWATDNPVNPWSTADGEALQTYLHGLDPNLVINNRVDKRRVVDGDYGTPEQEIPSAPVGGQLWESCMTLNDHWGYASYDTNWKSATTLTRNVVDIASRGGNYLLNIGPDKTGAVPPGAVDRLRSMGSWLSANGQGAAVYGAGAARNVATPAWGAVASAPGNKLEASVYTWPGAGKPLHLKATAPLTITGARVLGSSQQVTVKAAGDGYDITPSGAAVNATATVIELTYAPPQPANGTGTGLTAQYWDNTSFSGAPKVTRTDPTVNFAWRYLGSPAPAVPADNFSARWTGSVQPRYSRTYTFLTVSDDTVQVWVDGQQIISNTTPHDAAVNTGTVTLQAGKKYSIRIDFTERTGEAAMKLLWYAPDEAQRIVPASQLYPS